MCSCPNLIGCTIVEIDRIEGRKLFVRKLDAIDGTPVLDIKPVFKAFLPSDPVREPAWATELTAEYW